MQGGDKVAVGTFPVVNGMQVKGTVVSGTPSNAQKTGQGNDTHAPNQPVGSSQLQQVGGSHSEPKPNRFSTLETEKKDNIQTNTNNNDV